MLFHILGPARSLQSGGDDRSIVVWHKTTARALVVYSYIRTQLFRAMWPTDLHRVLQPLLSRGCKNCQGAARSWGLRSPTDALCWVTLS